MLSLICPLFSLILSFFLVQKRREKREKKAYPSKQSKKEKHLLIIFGFLFVLERVSYCICFVVEFEVKKMMVANSFDLWQKDAFFSAAEEVQESADVYVFVSCFTFYICSVQQFVWFLQFYDYGLYFELGFACCILMFIICFAPEVVWMCVYCSVLKVAL